MKHTLITTALVAILGLAFVGAPITAQAQTTNATSSTAPATASTKKKSDKTDYKGSITAIDATSVTVTNKEKTLTLAIAPTTKYLKDGKTAALTDFAVGDVVSGSYTKDSTGAMTAYSLHKKTHKTSKTPASTTTAPAATTTPATTPAAQ